MIGLLTGRRGCSRLLEAPIRSATRREGGTLTGTCREIAHSWRLSHAREAREVGTAAPREVRAMCSATCTCSNSPYYRLTSESPHLGASCVVGGCVARGLGSGRRSSCKTLRWHRAFHRCPRNSQPPPARTRREGTALLVLPRRASELIRACIARTEEEGNYTTGEDRASPPSPSTT